MAEECATGTIRPSGLSRQAKALLNVPAVCGFGRVGSLREGACSCLGDRRPRGQASLDPPGLRSPEPPDGARSSSRSPAAATVSRMVVRPARAEHPLAAVAFIVDTLVLMGRLARRSAR